MIEFPENIEHFITHHLPIIKSYADKIGLVEIINSTVKSEMEVEPGFIILGLVLDSLSGRSPLYRLEEFFEDKDVELLLGKDLEPEVFNDDAVGRVLDKLYESGTQKIFSEISLRAQKAFNINSPYVRYDTTSKTVYGDYKFEEDEEQPFNITFGYSKDHRPDLKQFLVEMLCVDRNIPVFGCCADGNGSDKKLNNKLLTKVTKNMSEYGLRESAFIYIADAAVVSKENLEELDKILFITRLPATYNECSRVIQNAVEKDDWKDVGILAETKPTKNRPGTYYKLCESELELYGKKYRAVVVHSSSHDKRRQKKLDKELEKSYQELKDFLKEEEKKEYFCLKDAEAASKRLMKFKTKYHKLNFSIETIPKYLPGRPPKDGKRKVKEERYKLKGNLIENTSSIQKRTEESGCFVLLTNVPQKKVKEAHTGLQVLKAYKEQHGIESNFSFLKDPTIVNDLFLKNPKRIEALGLVLLISLLIWRLIENSMRQYIKSTDKKLPGWDKKPTDRPTSFMMTTKFKGILTLKIGKYRRLSKPLSNIQLKYLKALGLENDIFTTVRAG
ncbi:MAG: IS1634 family transposase [Candidatus Margulisbacteria bacterium]|nr:IS1634 family transposase [Candidatus Margulisiibacteriota bacterium]